MSHDCPWCDRSYKEMFHLCRHVIREHAERDLSVKANIEIGHGRYLTVLDLTLYVSGIRPTGSVRWIRCWCKVEFNSSGYKAVSFWARHLRELGGMEAHLLDLIQRGWSRPRKRREDQRHAP